MDNLGHTDTSTTVSCSVLSSLGWLVSSCMKVCSRGLFETSSLLKPTNDENELQQVFSSPSALPGWVTPGGRSPSGAALILVVVHGLPGLLWWEQVSWGMLWSLLLWISAAYVKPAGFYPEQMSA